MATRSSVSAQTASGPSGSSSLTSATVSVGAPPASGAEYSVEIQSVRAVCRWTRRSRCDMPTEAKVAVRRARRGDFARAPRRGGFVREGESPSLMSVSPCCTTAVSLHSCAVPHLSVLLSATRDEKMRSAGSSSTTWSRSTRRRSTCIGAPSATSATAYEPSRLARKQIASSSTRTASPNSRCCTGGSARHRPPVRSATPIAYSRHRPALHPPPRRTVGGAASGFSTVGSTISCSGGSGATCAEPPVASATAGPCVRRRTSPGRSGRAMERDAGGAGKARMADAAGCLQHALYSHRRNSAISTRKSSASVSKSMFAGW